MKEEFKEYSGLRRLKVDCGNYYVVISFCETHKESYSMIFKTKGKDPEVDIVVHGPFWTQWEEGCVSVKWRDRWGSSMEFIQWEPSSLKGMFDFIAKGYNVYEKII